MSEKTIKELSQDLFTALITRGLSLTLKEYCGLTSSEELTLLAGQLKKMSMFEPEDKETITFRDHRRPFKEKAKEEMLNLSNEAGKIKQYKIDGDDVIEILESGCGNNKTIGLKKQIEGLFRLAGKQIRVEIVGCRVDMGRCRVLKKHIERYHTDEKPLVQCPRCHYWVKNLYILYSVNPDLDGRRCMLCIETARRENQ